MALDDDVREIRGMVNEMNIRGLDNARIQGNTLAKIESMEATLTDIKEKSHTSLTCDMRETVLETKHIADDNKDDIAKLKRRYNQVKAPSMSMKKQVGLITAITGGAVALAEVIARMLRP